MSRSRGLALVALVVVACGGADVVAHSVEHRAGVPVEPVDAGKVEAPDYRTVCEAVPDARGGLLASAAVFTRAPGTCRGDAFCDWVDAPPDPKDTCFVANDNIARAEADARRASPDSRASAPATLYLDRVSRHLGLTPDERARLDKIGFVVLDRSHFGAYAVAYHDVFQEQLPVFVSVDSILHAIFSGEDALLENTERERLGPALVSLLTKMTTALRTAGLPREAAQDLDVYLSTAATLAGRAGSVFPEDRALVRAVAQKAHDATAIERVTLFGRERLVDFNRFTPRGHYADVLRGPTMFAQPAQFPAYFQAMVWLSHLEINVVSRDSRSSHPDDTCDARETPREARLALALADVAKRAGVLDTLADFENVYRAFAGAREDLPVADLVDLMAKSRLGVNDADKLVAAIGARYKRTTRTHPMPDCAKDLPVITTLFGERVVPDVAPLTGLVHPAVAERYELGAADLGSVLGHDRAKVHLANDLAHHPSLASALATSRATLVANASGKTDLYATWLRAVLALADKPAGVVPSFMKTPAYADLRMNSAIVGYGQIRHNFVLMAAQGYDAYGCEIPDGWVEPATGTYDALIAYAKAARAFNPMSRAYYDRLEKVLGMLRAIAQTELDGKPLSEPQRRWLGMITEYTPIGGYSDSGEPPKYTGWYYDLFPDREKGAEKDPSFVADYFTLTNRGLVANIGVDEARLGVFVVDTGGGPRAMVGPVAKGYELKTKLDDKRLDDETASKAPGKTASWTATYLAPSLGIPLEHASFSCDDGTERIAVWSARPLGRATVTLLDHHGDPASLAVGIEDVGRRPRIIAFAVRAPVQHVDASAEYAQSFLGTPTRPHERFEGYDIALPAVSWHAGKSPSVYSLNR